MHSDDRSAPWVAVGLRADTGVIDVASVQGKVSYIGLFAPDRHDKILMDTARGLGRAMNPAIGEKHTLLERLSHKMGMSQSPEEFGTTIEPIVTEQGRTDVLRLFSEDHALAFGAMVRAHPNLRKMDLFEGPARAGDIRHPGVVGAINTINGAQFGDGFKIVRKPEVAKMWDEVATRAPGAIAMVEEVAQKHRLQTITSGSLTPERAFERMAEATLGRYVSGEERTRAGQWVEALGKETVRPDTRTTMMGALEPLSKREQDTPQLWSSQSLDRMAAATRMAQSADRPYGTQDVVEAVVQRAPKRVVESIGMDMAWMEDTLGRDPLGNVRARVVEQVVKPATQEAALASGRPVQDMGTKMEAHAQYAIIGSARVEKMPSRVWEAHEALEAQAQGDAKGKEMVASALFQTPEDQRLSPEKRGVIPLLRGAGARVAGNDVRA